MEFIVCRSNADSLQHHGIIGQKWGIRRFQREDRTWTEAGKDRYNDGPGGGKSSGETSKSSSDSVKSTAKTVTEKVKSGVSSAKEKAADTAKSIKDKTVDTAKDAKDKAVNAIKEATKQPTQEELDTQAERSAKRKDVAKKVAIGVGIAAAVVGTAFVAKYAHDKVKDLKAFNSGDFADKLSASLDLEFKALDNNKTYNAEQQGLIKKSKSGLSGVLQRKEAGSIYRSPESIKLDKDLESGSVDRNKASVYRVLNGAVDTYLKKSLSEGEAVKESKYYSRVVTNKEVEEARDFANTYAGYLLRDYGDNVQNEYLSDVAREFVRTFSQRIAA